MSGRKQKRYRLDHIVPVGFVGAGHRFVGDLLNISATGMLVKCAVDVRPGAVLRAGIETNNEMIRFRGRGATIRFGSGPWIQVHADEHA